MSKEKDHRREYKYRGIDMYTEKVVYFDDLHDDMKLTRDGTMTRDAIVIEKTVNLNPEYKWYRLCKLFGTY